MKRKKLFLLMIAFLLIGTSRVVGQEKSDVTPVNLKGIWQMCFYVSGTPQVPGELKPSNSFKILSDDGKFTNMTMIPNLAGTPFQEFIALQIGKINIGCLKAICIDAFFRYVHSHIPHQLNQVVHIQDVRYVVHRHLFGCEQGGADNLQHLVLRSLRINVSGKAVSAFYYK